MLRPCRLCVHAILIPDAGLYCSRSGGWYRCEDERALGWVAALAYDACGARGRFFSERRDTPDVRPWAPPVFQPARPDWPEA